MKKSLKNIVIALLSAALVAGIFAFGRQAGWFRFKADARPVAAAIKAKLTLPALIGSTTRLDDVKAAEDRVVYVITILKPREDALDFAGYQNAYFPENACKSDEYMKMFAEGLTVQNEYLDLDGEHAQTVTVTPAQCGFKEGK